MIYFTSDTHFGHKRILESFCPNRSAAWNSVQEMDEGLIEAWNKTVKDDDTVYHLGDVSFSKANRTREILDRLHGRIVLIIGNHDQQIMSMREKFVSMHDLLEVRYHEHRVVLCHYPFEQWNRMHHGAIHLHGHTHGQVPSVGRRADVGIDSDQITGSYDHRPISIEEVIEWAKDKPMVPHDNG